MLIFALLFQLIASQPSCETVGPRLDGTRVTICGGHVVAVSDAAGNVHVRPFGGVR